MTCCWNCGKWQWFCDLKHLFSPIFEGLLIGLIVGASAGVITYWIVKVFGWLVRR